MARPTGTGSSKAPSKTGIDLSGATKSVLPATISPMLATLVDKPVEGPGWLYEIKWDGYRAIAICNKSTVKLISRNNKSFDEKFYPIHQALKNLGWQAVLDGEIAVLKGNGVSDFGALQNWRSEADGELIYYVFDLLWLNGFDLMPLPLTRRRAILASFLPQEGPLRISQHFDTTASAFLAAAAKLGLEGIIAKRGDSVYSPGERSRDWLKIKTQKRHEVVIGGFTRNERSPKPFSSLLVGVFDKKKLHYIGKIGTGFNGPQQKDMIKQFKPLGIDHSPFTITPDVNEPSRFRPDPPHAEAFWLKPVLVCEVSYAELTADGVMRHPSFRGMREDKPAKDVHAEIALPSAEALAETNGKNAAGKRAAGAKARGGRPFRLNLKTEAVALRKTLLNPTDETQVRKVNGHELKFNHLGKVFWPKEGFTKRHLLNYYYQASEYLLPYLKDRPQSLNRFPNGIAGKSFYYKNVTDTAPDWVKQFPYHTSEGEDKNFLVVEDEASILWMANMGAIEMNPWNSTIRKPDHPDWCIIDLDPTEKNTFEQVIRTAQTTRKILEALRIESYPKTSGSTGIHIYIPLGKKYSYEECQLFGRLIATAVHHELPAFTSIERMTRNRMGKIYVDFLQNRPKATLAAPYSVRPKPKATVSMPLHWEEVKKGLKMTQFTMKNAIERIRSEGDIFKGVLGKGIDIAAALAVLDGRSFAASKK
jgi:bifunctional non-homologous end joining protein LigD